jgi:signal-transduction protein with cAMP-binding, CBS, and nucleotidyltransferase domain
MEKIADVINQKFPQFNTIPFSSSVNDALSKMHCENVDYLIVMDENENFIGLLTEHDIASKVLFNPKELDQCRISEFMTASLPVATMDDSIEYALQLLENYKSKYLAVYNQFDFKGILNMQDLVKVALAKSQVLFSGMQPQRQGYPWNY